ncbi:DNA replication protein DnaC [Bradyrhizobium sp. USDA 4471]
MKTGEFSNGTFGEFTSGTHNYRTPRGLDRPLFAKLVEGRWIDDHVNLLICGPAGVGKSWLASALGHKACRDNRSVLYQRVPRARGVGDDRRRGRAPDRRTGAALAVSIC